MGRMPLPFWRLHAYLSREQVSDSGHFDPPGSEVLPRIKSTPPVHVLVLPRGDQAKVGIDESGNVQWFTIEVPGSGLLYIEPHTSLISPIAEKVERYLSANDL